MIIEVNKDIDRYKETVVLGLTARQLIFSIVYKFPNLRYYTCS